MDCLTILELKSIQPRCRFRDLVTADKEGSTLAAAREGYFGTRCDEIPQSQHCYHRGGEGVEEEDM